MSKELREQYCKETGEKSILEYFDTTHMGDIYTYDTKYVKWLVSKLQAVKDSLMSDEELYGLNLDEQTGADLQIDKIKKALSDE